MLKGMPLRLVVAFRLKPSTTNSSTGRKLLRGEPAPSYPLPAWHYGVSSPALYCRSLSESYDKSQPKH